MFVYSRHASVERQLFIFASAACALREGNLTYKSSDRDDGVFSRRRWSEREKQRTSVRWDTSRRERASHKSTAVSFFSQFFLKFYLRVRPRAIRMNAAFFFQNFNIRVGLGNENALWPRFEVVSFIRRSRNRAAVA